MLGKASSLNVRTVCSKDFQRLGVGQELEAVLLAYRDDLGGLGRGVPQSLYRAATRIFDDAATVEPC